MSLTEDPEPLGWSAFSAPADDGRSALRFEFSSRGDRVSGRLEGRATAQPTPLLLIAQSGTAKQRPALAGLRERVLSRGGAVAQLELPLCGMRSEQKLAACVNQGLGGRGPMAALAREFVTQAVSDLRRGLDALSGLVKIAEQRVAFAGVGLAAEIGAHFCALDPRPQAALLALAGRPSEDPQLDAARSVADIAPRPVLLIDAQQPVGEAVAGRLYAVAGEPRAQLVLGRADELDGERALESMERFIADAVGL